jgi:hypothetical protein
VNPANVFKKVEWEGVGKISIFLTVHVSSFLCHQPACLLSHFLFGDGNGMFLYGIN